MASILRLKNYKTYMRDGRSSVTYGVQPKQTVAVALVLGYEPLKTDGLPAKDSLDIDKVILSIARFIERKRAEDARNKAKARSRKPIKQRKRKPSHSR